MVTRLGLVSALLVMMAACAPAAPGTVGQGGQQAAPGQSQKTIIAIGMDEDITSIWDAITSGGGTGSRELANVVNQHLVAITADGSPTPRLLTELPSIERGTWTVLPDGGMETIWSFRPNAVWHDGTPLTADDILFSFAVNRDPDVPNANQEAVRLITRVDAVDANTVKATWSELYPFADRLEHRELFPLPRHILERSYREPKDSFLLQPYFSDEYVGLGPYRVARWERGSHLDVTAFDQFFLGRPKIDTVRFQFITDTNTMLANLNSRAIQIMLTLGNGPTFESMMQLKRDWEESGYGTVLKDPVTYRFAEPQKRGSASPPDLADPRVRQALMYAMDRQELVRVSFGDAGILADSWLHPDFPQYRQMQDAMKRYSFDPSRASALLEEAGWRRGSDNTLEKNGQRFAVTMRDADGETDALILASNWRAVGVSATYEPRSTALLRDREDRSTFTGVDITSNVLATLSASRKLATINMPVAANRWTGTNRGAYSNPAWDELDKRAYGSLQEKDRIDVERELVRIFTTDLPLLPLYFRYDVVPVGGGITGLLPNTGVAHRGFILHTWNIADWDIPAKS